jgi:hypothetical protein
MLKILVLAALLSAATPIMADGDAIGTVVASRGVNATSEGRELMQGSFVYMNDTVITSDRAFVVIQFTDGTKLTVRPDSELILETYVYNSTGEDEMRLNLISGGLRVISGAVAKNNPENFKLNTPVALMGVRGTEFSIMLCGEETCVE